MLRNSLTPQVTFLLLTLIVVCAIAGDKHAELTTKEIAALRTAVYEDNFAWGAEYTDPENGDGPRCLILPNVIHTLYSRKPLPTLEFLLKVVEVGRPEDANRAAAYGFGAGRKNCPFGLFLVNFENYDMTNKELGMSEREYAVSMVKHRIDKLKSANRR